MVRRNSVITKELFNKGQVKLSLVVKDNLVSKNLP